MNLRNDTASGAAQPHTESAPPYGRTYQAGSSPEKALVKSLCEQCSQQAARLNPPQAANRFSSFEVSKSEPAEKQVPHSRMFRLKSEVQSPALGKNTAQIIEKAYADSFFLPLLRLRASTLRPLAVLMRLRKP